MGLLENDLDAILQDFDGVQVTLEGTTVYGKWSEEGMVENDQGRDLDLPLTMRMLEVRRGALPTLATKKTLMVGGVSYKVRQVLPARGDGLVINVLVVPV